MLTEKNWNTQINKPHLAYTILGGFTSVFMLVSLFIKEKLYIGEATVATICGVIFGPAGAGVFDPSTWGNVDQITLEVSRVVLVVQCFAVGVELPKKYMERHWKSVVFLLIPVMTWGWLITSLVIWWMIPSLSWLESLACAACATATDPVLASSGVGKGKFARRIPGHLRDLLSAESGCCAGVASPFISLSLYLIHYRPNATEVFKHWFCLTVLYECLFGAIYGSCVGYAGRWAIRWAERRNIIDRESFLVFYFTLALWCAGTGSIFGLDLLVGFRAGVAFSNDGWFALKTEESHVSNVIDLLLNLAYFVYFGSIIPWDQYRGAGMGIEPWRFVVIAIFVILFRRIPILLALKPVIPDIKTGREALYAGHFAPIGGNAIFVAILARAELETRGATPLAQLPAKGVENYNLMVLIWPITTFLVISSIVVHGSSVAVFALGKHINTMNISASFTTASFATASSEPSWLVGLPLLTPKMSMSIRKPDLDESSDGGSTLANDRLVPPGTLPPPGGVPGGFLKGEMGPRETDTPAVCRPASITTKRRKNQESRMGPGGAISSTAITPSSRQETEVAAPEHISKRDDIKKYGHYLQPPGSRDRVESYQEGRATIAEDEQGDVLQKHQAPGTSEGEHVGPSDAITAGENRWLRAEVKEAEIESKQPKIQKQTTNEVTEKRSPLRAARGGNGLGGSSRRKKLAWAYSFGGNIIIEDQDGEVIRRYKLPKPKRAGSSSKRSSTFGDWAGRFGGKKNKIEAALENTQADDDNGDAETVHSDGEDEHRGKGIHFRIQGERGGGRKMSKKEFLHQLQKMSPHSRAEVVSRSELPSQVSAPASALCGSATRGEKATEPASDQSDGLASPAARGSNSSMTCSTYQGGHTIDYNRDEETTAERKRREAALGITANEDSDSDDESRIRSPGVNFTDQPRSPSSALAPRGITLSWARDTVMRKGKGKE